MALPTEGFSEILSDRGGKWIIPSLTMYEIDDRLTRRGGNKNNRFNQVRNLNPIVNFYEFIFLF